MSRLLRLGVAAALAAGVAIPATADAWTCTYRPKLVWTEGDPVPAVELEKIC